MSSLITDLTLKSSLAGTEEVCLNDSGADKKTTIALIRAVDTDGTLAANSDALVPSQKAVRTYVASLVAGLLDLKGGTDASSHPNYPAAVKGDAYWITVAGIIGSASGKPVEVGDLVVAIADNAGGDEVAAGGSWLVLETNIHGITEAGLTVLRATDAAAQKTAIGLGNVTNDEQIKAADLDTDTTLTANSDANVPSQAAVKAHVAAGLATKLDLAWVTLTDGMQLENGKRYVSPSNGGTPITPLAWSGGTDSALVVVREAGILSFGGKNYTSADGPLVFTCNTTTTEVIKGSTPFGVEWVANESAGDKTVAVQDYAETDLSGDDTVDATKVNALSQQVIDLTKKLQAIQAALAARLLPNA